MKINDTSFGLWVGQKLRESQKGMESSLAKIASGRRINKAADDAAGMLIADALGSQADAYGQAIRNATDAISMAQIAEGALQESGDIVQEIRVKALQAANGSQSTESRQAIQSDIQKLTAQLDNIAQNTSYNGQKLLSGNFSEQSFQIGANAGETITLSIGSSAAGDLGSPEGGALSEIDVTTQEGAQAAIAVADAALADIGRMRSEIGSTQNQLGSTINNLSNTQINVLSAESTIRDVDLAEESMVLNKMRLLHRARVFAAAQANAKEENVSKLLGLKV